MTEKYIQIRIKEDTKHGQFRDALYFTEEEYDKLSEQDLQAKIDERVNNWVAIMDKPYVPYVPTEEELLLVKEEKLRELQEVEKKLAEIIEEK